MDLRDRSGILQIVFEGEEQAELMEKASKLRSEVCSCSCRKCGEEKRCSQ